MDKTRHFTDRPEIKRWINATQPQDLRDSQTLRWSSRLREVNEHAANLEQAQPSGKKTREPETV